MVESKFLYIIVSSLSSILTWVLLMNETIFSNSRSLMMMFVLFFVVVVSGYLIPLLFDNKPKKKKNFKSVFDDPENA